MEEESPETLAEKVMEVAESEGFCPVHFPIHIFNSFGESVSQAKGDPNIHNQIVMTYLMGVTNAVCTGETDKEAIARFAIADAIRTCKNELGVTLAGIMNRIDRGNLH